MHRYCIKGTLMILMAVCCLNYWSIIESMNQSMNQSMNHLINQQVTKSINKSKTIPINVEPRMKEDNHCFNDIFDAIFVLSTRSRMNQAATVLHQFEQYNIKTILWEGYSIDNPTAQSLYQSYRNRCKNSPDLVSYIPKQNSPFWRFTTFTIRQAKFDMITYAKQQNYSNFLIIEDDVILADHEYFNKFCEIYNQLPKFDVLSIGINEHNKKNVQLHDTNTIFKYYNRTSRTFGGFAWAISSSMYDLFLDKYDFNKHCADWPFDVFQQYVTKKADGSKLNCINVVPTLFIPNVEKSDHSKNNEQNKWVDVVTFIGSHFKRDWKSLYSQNYQYLNPEFFNNTIQNQQRISSLFDQSPSRGFWIAKF